MADERNEPTSATDPYGLLQAGDAGILGIDNVRLYQGAMTNAQVAAL